MAKLETKYKLEPIWEEFILWNEALSGIQPPNGEIDEAHERHREIVHIVSRAHQLINPYHINATLIGQHNNILRTGRVGSFGHEMPGAGLAARLLWYGEKQLRRSLDNLRDMPQQDRSQFSWKMHDSLLSLHIFRTANGRTARIFLNHLRQLIGLDVVVVHNGAEYFRRLKEFRKEFLGQKAFRMASETATAKAA